MKLNKFLILLLITNISIAQQITAHINKVTTKEFYKIIVASEIRSAIEKAPLVLRLLMMFIKIKMK